MKSIFALLVLLASSVSFAEGMDGCYQLYTPGAPSSQICLMGTAEEGIGGGGAVLAMFGADSGDVAGCYVSSSISVSEDQFVFKAEGRDLLVLSNFREEDGLLLGDAKVGRIELLFGKLSKSDSARLMMEVRESDVCRNARN